MSLPMYCKYSSLTVTNKVQPTEQQAHSSNPEEQGRVKMDYGYMHKQGRIMSRDHSTNSKGRAIAQGIDEGRNWYNS